MKLKFHSILLFILYLMSAASTWGQTVNYPNRPIRIIVPYAAGGGTDSAARAMSQKLGQLLGQPIIIENKPGASTQVGTLSVVKASPDGYTLLMGTANLATNVALFDKMPYDAQKDLKPVSLITKVPVYIFVPSNSSIKNVPDLISKSKSNPDGLSYASPGNGSSAHLAGELFKNDSKSNLQHIPYKGSSEATTALIGGQVQLSFDNYGPVMAQVKSGNATPIAIAMPARSSLTPNIPTLKELGYPMEAYSWWGILAPTGTPAPIIEKLNTAIQTTLKDPEVRESLQKQGVEIIGSTPTEFADHIKAETVKWSQVSKQANIKAE
ncbi:tripartite tricarboxylate transporter substrate binding protein [Polynucleobacter sp. JS-Fieb-80-E5]|jgi:tripartite-type tricarboxylate transporter receptor subunit TctC|uniref:tripartite tricarboxylate transporter substrate binding protein n=1 Tax=Polynucleobacter sp. JS-Fieb-80-E5 TaxID=2081050 RepID=UPI001C0B688F|nr:tripartite tricarboxylate transporter substrate binding protein [Polynucleobacter sp. JS-Fieb-80-E5]MBU3619387.1 tripartite tricarboxylate transporter substrate binding protein [Polynucleobacter sp. JS-Fieb-80-E5]